MLGKTLAEARKYGTTFGKPTPRGCRASKGYDKRPSKCVRIKPEDYVPCV